MGLLQGISCYCAGPVEANQDDNWRVKILPKLKNFGLSVWDPLVKPSWMPNITGDDQRRDKSYINNIQNHDLMSAHSRFDECELERIYYQSDLIRDVCLRLVSAADFVICKIGGPTVGTFHELAVANNQNKPILFFTDTVNKIDSMWRLSQFSNKNNIKDVFFGPMDDLIGYLSQVNDGSKKVDKLKWIFLPDNWPIG